MRDHFASIDGAATRYYLAGSGYPLLLVHGVGVSSDIWLRNIEALSADFTVCAPDTLGHGFTETGAYRGGALQPYLVDHLAQLVEHLGFQDFQAVGSSFGALLRHPLRDHVGAAEARQLGAGVSATTRRVVSLHRHSLHLA